MRINAILAASCAAMSLASPANAASFKCGKATTADEIAICRTPTLSDLDVTMATLYGVRMQLPMLMGPRGAAQEEPRHAGPAAAACCVSKRPTSNATRH